MLEAALALPPRLVPQEPPMQTARSRLSPKIDLDGDGKQTGFLRLPHSVHRSAYGWIPIPIARISNRGVNGSGPTILLMAGNHGDEYEGQVALGRLIRELDPAEVRGRVIILPSANFPAAMAGTRTSPLDQGNLNRSFPGDPAGGPTAQIAYYIEHELLPRCDFVLDIHSGGSWRADWLFRRWRRLGRHDLDRGGTSRRRPPHEHRARRRRPGDPGGVAHRRRRRAPCLACPRRADERTAARGTHDAAHAGQRQGLLLLCAGAGPLGAARRARRRGRGGRRRG